jgi:hypothetical protein
MSLSWPIQWYLSRCWSNLAADGTFKCRSLHISYLFYGPGTDAVSPPAWSWVAWLVPWGLGHRQPPPSTHLELNTIIKFLYILMTTLTSTVASCTVHHVYVSSKMSPFGFRINFTEASSLVFLCRSIFNLRSCDQSHCPSIKSPSPLRRIF